MYEDVINDILQIIKIYSPTQDRNACKKALGWFESKAKDFGFESEYRANGEILVIGNNNSISADIGVICHADVVPVNPNEWKYSPYGERINGRIYGRGIIDDKGAIVIILHVMKEIQKKGTDKIWQIIIGTREEEIWSDVKKYFEEDWALPKLSFSPDDDWPMSNREKGYCDVTFNFQLQDGLKVIQAGDTNNSVPAKAVAIWNGKKVFMNGKVAHSSVPWLGENAIVKLFSYLNVPVISKFCERFIDTFDGTKSLGLPSHQRFVNGEYMGYTTAVPTMCYQDKEGVHIIVNIRSMYGTTRNEIEQSLNKIILETECTYSIDECLDPLRVPANNPFIVKMQDAYEKVMGERPKLALCCGTSYAKVFPNTVIFGPRFTDEEDSSHCSDESQSESDIEKNIQIYFSALEKILEPDKIIKNK